MPETREIVGRSFPQLQDLVDEGVLVVHRRPDDYVEWRADGYREPELVFIVGTAHVSAKSADDVQRVVAAVRPECVVVELCRSRTALLHGGGGDGDQGEQQQQQQEQPQPQQQQQLLQQQREEQQRGKPAAERDAAAEGSYEEQQLEQQRAGRSTSHAQASPSGGGSGGGGGGGDPSGRGVVANPLGLSGGSFAEAMQRALAQGGQSGLVLRLLLASQAKRAADRLGVKAGAEFAAAAAAADAVGAQLVLGDRPLEITLQRGWDALGWRRRAALLADLTRAAAAPLPPELSSELVESLKEDGAVSSMFAQWGALYPELVPPLVTERDLYLAWSLKRSKAVNGARCVVGVIGKGHLRGVVYALRHDNGSLRFADLVGGRNKKSVRRRQAAERLAVELLVGSGAWVAWLWLTGGL